MAMEASRYAMVSISMSSRLPYSTWKMRNATCDKQKTFRGTVSILRQESLAGRCSLATIKSLSTKYRRCTKAVGSTIMEEEILTMEASSAASRVIPTRSIGLEITTDS